ASACISTSSSWVNIPHGPPHSSWLQEPVTVRGTPDRTARTRQGTTAGSALRASPTAAPRRVSSRPVRVGNFGDQIRGENRDRGQVSMPTPWNHLEAGILFGLRLPLLIFREKEIEGGVVDRGVSDVFIHDMPAP